MNTEDHTTPRPGGMTVKAWRTRNRKPFCESNSGPQVLGETVGLNTSGALSGIRASSFPNPVLAPPRALSIFADWYYKTNLPAHPPHHIKSGNLLQRTRSAFSTIAIGVGNLIISRKKSFRDWKIICTRNCTKSDAI